MARTRRATTGGDRRMPMGRHFPVQIVLGITFSAAAIAGTQWASTSDIRASTDEIRTSINDITKRLEVREQIDAANAKLQEERSIQIREAIQAMRNRQELQQIEIQSLKEMILRGQQK